jgi:hypothetical protein
MGVFLAAAEVPLAAFAMTVDGLKVHLLTFEDPGFFELHFTCLCATSFLLPSYPHDIAMT